MNDPNQPAGNLPPINLLNKLNAVADQPTPISIVVEQPPVMPIPQPEVQAPRTSVQMTFLTTFSHIGLQVVAQISNSVGVIVNNLTTSNARSQPPPTSTPVYFKCTLEKLEIRTVLLFYFYQCGILQASTSSAQSAEKSGVEVQEEKSEIYSNNMAQAMGAVLTYRHELGMNYNFIRPDLIVGSCLQTPADVEKLINIGVRTIFCLQQNSDLEYFGVDFHAIEEYAKKSENVERCHAEIRDFDAFDLRMRLPAVVSILHKAINRNGGVTYIHCTAGLGRAPSVALAYMYWVLGYNLSEGHNVLQSKRACCPKLEGIRSATADILTGLPKSRLRLTWKGGKYSSVEVSGLDIGWGQRIPLKFNQSQGVWILERDLPEGHYEYKYIVDGKWICNSYELTTCPNGDGHVNNYIDVSGTNSDAESKALRKRLMTDDGLSTVERKIIRDFLEQ